jgi:MSHA biogenesis protein MshM
MAAVTRKAAQKQPLELSVVLRRPSTPPSKATKSLIPAESSVRLHEKSSTTESSEAPATASKTLGLRAQQRFEATQDWLRAAPGKNYSIQLITVPDSEPARLENFLGRAQKLLPGQDLYVYSVKINGIQNFRVALGNYSSTQDVRTAMAELPVELKAPNPYFRSIERMRSQNSQ